MNVTIAVVRSVEGNEATVEVESTGCGRCHEPGGCGGAAKADLFCHGRVFRVADRLGASVGDRVRVAVDEGAVGFSATRAYALPLACLMFGAFLGRFLGDQSLGDLPVIAGAAFGLGAGWFLLRALPTADGRLRQPKIVGRA